MRKLFYFLAFLFIACVACDSKNEPVPPVPPEPIKPKPISPQDSINRLLEGIWEIDTVETFKYEKILETGEYYLHKHTKTKYIGNEKLKLQSGILLRKEDGKNDFFVVDYSWYGMKGDTAYIKAREYRPDFIFPGYTSYHYYNKKGKICKIDDKPNMFYRDTILYWHNKMQK